MKTATSINQRNFDNGHKPKPMVDCWFYRYGSSYPEGGYMTFDGDIYLYARKQIESALNFKSFEEINHFVSRF